MTQVSLVEWTEHLNSKYGIGSLRADINTLTLCISMIVQTGLTIPFLNRCSFRHISLYLSSMGLSGFVKGYIWSKSETQVMNNL